ncbi:hypothetical protein I7I51_05581 [Histoplasma capsulatum]|uniref:Aminoglycoside phosphotransferase domain-containing protein n=1 Tax=Ajellomyces capsulatus TaxID=5037 RepID=A0A8A1M2V9_AJECA|nr:hypothetical protein I7I51_05581 [Histoplasma capsulatum]
MAKYLMVGVELNSTLMIIIILDHTPIARIISYLAIIARYYYTHADNNDILMDLFDKVTVAQFIESLKFEKENISNNVQLFQTPDAEPWVLVHEDFHAGNVLVRDGCLVGIVDWEFSGVYLSILLASF